MMDTTNIKKGSRNSKHIKNNIKLNPKEIQNLREKELEKKLNRNSMITSEFNLSSKLNDAAIKMETNDIDVAIILYYISYEINENVLAKDSLIELTGTNDNHSFYNIYKSKVEKLQKNIEQKLDEDYILQEKDDEILKLLKDIADEIEKMSQRDPYLMIYLIIFNINKDEEARTNLINNNSNYDIKDSLIIKLARPVEYYDYDDYTIKNIGWSYINLYRQDECQEDNFEYFEKALDYAIPYFRYEDHTEFIDFICMINFYKDDKFYKKKHLQKIVDKIEGHSEMESILNKCIINR